MKARKFKDTMIAAKNYESMVDFYKSYVGFEVVERTTDFVLLKDQETSQLLCITNGASVAMTSPGIEVLDLEQSLTELESLGGKIRRRWDFQVMKGANCEDPEGNELMIWQTVQ